MNIINNIKSILEFLYESPATPWAISIIVIVFSIVVLFNCHPLSGFILFLCGILLLGLAIYSQFMGK